MPQQTLQSITVNTCSRCGHEWPQRKTDGKPIRCAKCRSPYWDKDKLKRNQAS
jgi:DNA-directed RNA polymerase subunit RPC12/RpoP